VFEVKEDKTMHIKIGTRGSKLALWQAYYVEDLLQKGGVETEIVIIETKGDQILDRSLSKIGSKGVFTQELEDQLISGDIDIAVHSAKDLQSQLDDAFELIAFTEREKANDVLVSHDTSLSLKSGESFVVGTEICKHAFGNWKKANATHCFSHTPACTEWSTTIKSPNICFSTNSLRQLAREVLPLNAQ
jgi:hypothetical protein